MSHDAGDKRSLVRRLSIGLGFTLLALVWLSLAGCSLLASDPQIVLEIVPTRTPTLTHTLTPTWPPTWTVTPTYTPWPATPTPTATYTPIPTTTPLPPGVAPVRPGPDLSGALTVDFELNGVWCKDGGYVAEFTVFASGGGGQYKYYRDCTSIGGPTDKAVEYQLLWTRCGGAPGTFFAESADGQRASKLFWVHRPLCCDQTN